MPATHRNCFSTRESSLSTLLVERADALLEPVNPIVELLYALVQPLHALVQPLYTLVQSLYAFVELIDSLIEAGHHLDQSPQDIFYPNQRGADFLHLHLEAQTTVLPLPAFRSLLTIPSS